MLKVKLHIKDLKSVSVKKKHKNPLKHAPPYPAPKPHQKNPEVIVNVLLLVSLENSCL